MCPPAGRTPISTQCGSFSLSLTQLQVKNENMAGGKGLQLSRGEAVTFLGPGKGASWHSGGPHRLPAAVSSRVVLPQYAP